MATEEEVQLTFVVSTRLGAFGTALANMEPAIDETIRIVRNQEFDQPTNQSVPIMMKLLVAAKEYIAAHKTIEAVADLLTGGGMIHEGPEQVQ